MQTQLFGHVHTEATRAQVPIFDTTQMRDFLSIVGTWKCYPFQGLLLKHKRGIFGYRVHRTFNFRQRLPFWEYAFPVLRPM